MLCCCLVPDTSQHDQARAQPLPYPGISASSALSGVPGSLSPTPLPGLRVVPASWVARGGSVPIPKARFCDKGRCPKWPPGLSKAWFLHVVLANGGHIGLEQALDPVSWPRLWAGASWGCRHILPARGPGTTTHPFPPAAASPLWLCVPLAPTQGLT